jgi:TolB-like protein
LKPGLNFVVAICSTIAIQPLLGSSLFAQCADGSPPPCDRPVGRPMAMPIDANRVAVLPFRVTAADSLLGEGFAELLAPEFTGEGGPRSVNMSTTLNAWRRAGGGLRAPLSQPAAMKLAREIGAGLLAHGSIVGIGNRLRITAELYNSTTGKAVGAEVRAVGSTDSLEILLQQVATGLLTNAGATNRAREAARLTSSPAALRAYLEGLALARRGSWRNAEHAFIQSFTIDTTFASAAYRLWVMTSQQLRGAEWAARTRALREKLTPRDRAVADVFFQPGVQGREPILTARRRVAERLVDSPEAWFFYGDHAFHSGHSVVGEDSAVALARDAFSRAVALDTQPVFLYHLMEIALHQRDTVLLRTVWSSYPVESEEGWPRAWVAASFLRDAAMLARLRRIPLDTNSSTLATVALGAMMDAPVSPAHVDEAFRRLTAVQRPQDQAMSRGTAWLIHRTQGRPVAAERALTGSTLNAFRFPILTWGWLTGDVDTDEALMRAHAPIPPNDSIANQRSSCYRGYVHASRGRMDSLDATLGQRMPARCTRFLDAWSRFAKGTLSGLAVTALDAEAGVYSWGSFMGFEHRLLSRIYEARGDTVAALRVIQRYPRDYPGSWLAPTLREVGRVALLARDTVRARRAYDHYLELRSEVEVPFVAERDSIRALVARLRR